MDQGLSNEHVVADTAEVSPFEQTRWPGKVPCIATTLATHRGGWRRLVPEPGERARWLWSGVPQRGTLWYT